MKLPEFLVDHPDGEIRLTGHRIALTDIIELYAEGLSPEMMALTYPTLSLPLIYNVVAFYLNNKEECDKYAGEQAKDADRIREEVTKGQKEINIAELRRRMERIQKAENKRTA